MVPKLEGVRVLGMEGLKLVRVDPYRRSPRRGAQCKEDGEEGFLSFFRMPTPGKCLLLEYSRNSLYRCLGKGVLRIINPEIMHVDCEPG